MSRHSLNEARRKREWKKAHPEAVREQNKRAYLRRKKARNEARNENFNYASPARNEDFKGALPARNYEIQGALPARNEIKKLQGVLSDMEYTLKTDHNLERDNRSRIQGMADTIRQRLAELSA